MAGSFVQAQGAFDFNTTVTVSITVAAGGSLLVFWDIGVVDPTSVVSSVDGALTVVTGVGSGGRVAGFGYKIGATPGAHTITLTVASAAGLTMAAYEIAGVSAFLQSTGMTESFTALPVTSALTPGAAGQYAVALFCNSNATGFSSWTNSFAEQSDSNFAGGACQLAFADLTIPSTASLDAGATGTFGDSVARALLIFDVGGGASADLGYYGRQHQGD